MYLFIHLFHCWTTDGKNVSGHWVCYLKVVSIMHTASKVPW